MKIINISVIFNTIIIIYLHLYNDSRSMISQDDVKEQKKQTK